MSKMEKNSVDLLLTDIPYNEVNRKNNGLRNLDKGDVDDSVIDFEKVMKSFTTLTTIWYTRKGQGTLCTGFIGKYWTISFSKKVKKVFFYLWRIQVHPLSPRRW